mmetsp:Transcript_24536/g.41719  ORF Transcript_24536/g.41719 Transcript_24536/m.41719 type:complete len:108 (-) Transcript_24536:1827-2150(-)
MSTTYSREHSFQFPLFITSDDAKIDHVLILYTKAILEQQTLTLMERIDLIVSSKPLLSLSNTSLEIANSRLNNVFETTRVKEGFVVVVASNRDAMTCTHRLRHVSSR